MKISTIAIILYTCLDCFFLSASQSDSTKVVSKFKHSIEIASQGQFQSALIIQLEVLDALKEHNYDQYLSCLNQVGKSYFRLGNLKEAKLYAQKAYQLSDGYLPQKAQALQVIGFINITMGALEKAIQNLQESIDIIENQIDNPPPIDLANSIQILGTAYKNNGENRKAVELFKKSIAIKLKNFGADFPGLASTYIELGNAYTNLGKYDEALNSINLSITINVNNNLTTVYSLYQAGVVYSLNYEFNRAIESFRSAILENSSSTDPDKLLTANCLEGIGITQIQLGNPEEAISNIRQAIDIRSFIIHNNPIIEAQGLKNLSEAYLALNKYDSALQSIREAIEIEEESRVPNQYLFESLFSYGAILQKLGAVQEAKDGYFKAINLLKESVGAKHGKIAEVLTAISKTHLDNNQVDSALYYAQKAIIANSPGFDQASVSVNPNPESTLNPYVLLKSMILKTASLTQSYLSTRQPETKELALKNFIDAENLLEQLTKSFQSKDDLLQISEAAKVLYATRVDLEKQTAGKFKFIEYSRDIIRRLDLSEKIARTKAGIPIALLQKEDSLKGKIAELTALVNDPDIKQNHVTAQLFQTREKLTVLSSDLESVYPVYFDHKYRKKVIAIETVQQRIAEDEVLIEFMEKDSFLYVIAVTSDSTGFKRLKYDHLLRDKIRQFNLLSKDHSANYRQFITLSNSLYTQIIEPILAGLDKDQFKKLCIVPDGALWRLNFELLAGTNAGCKNYKCSDYLLNHFAIHYAYSATGQFDYRIKQTTTPKPIMAFSFGETDVYDRNIVSMNKLRSVNEELPGSRAEIKAISEIIEGDYYFGGLASEKQFKEKASAYQILHLAIHGETDDINPKNSKLFFYSKGDTLEDGYLHAYELFKMNLNADLAVLSACETGAGKVANGEGILSLGRAFAHAGVNSVVLTRWKVSDAFTPAIIQSFYKGLKKGKSKSEALRTAKLAFLKNSDNISSFPFYWGSFYALGDNQPISFRSDKKPWWMIAIAAICLLSLTIAVIRKQRVTSQDSDRHK